MIDNIYVFDDIIEKPYQELIKETLMGGDKPPTVDEVEELFPWYYVSDITDASHEGPFQGRFGFTHQYVTPEEGIVCDFHSLFFGLIQNSCKKLKIKEIDVLADPNNIPEYIEVDMERIKSKQKVRLSSLSSNDSYDFPSSLKNQDPVLVSVLTARGGSLSIDDEDETSEEGEENTDSSPTDNEASEENNSDPAEEKTE